MGLRLSGPAQRSERVDVRRRSSGSPSKYRNRPTVYNGRRYASKKEAEYARRLDLLVKAGQVRAWKAQPRYPLRVDGTLVSTYVADFLVEYADGAVEVVDVKGRKSGLPYQMFRLKAKLLHALHGIVVREV